VIDAGLAHTEGDNITGPHASRPPLCAVPGAAAHEAAKLDARGRLGFDPSRPSQRPLGSTLQQGWLRAAHRH
jgi:hypothetical protein